MEWKEWILITILLIFIIGAAFIVCGTGLELIRLSKIFQKERDRFYGLMVVLVGAFFIFLAYLVQLYLALHHDVTIYQLGKNQADIIAD